MQNIKTVADLQIAIQELEFKQADEWRLLKDDFQATTECLNPGNIIKSVFGEIVSTSNIKTAVIAYSAAFISKKLFGNKEDNLLTNLVGIMMETFALKSADKIMSIGSIILNKIMNHRKESEKSI